MVQGGPKFLLHLMLACAAVTAGGCADLVKLPLVRRWAPATQSTPVQPAVGQKASAQNATHAVATQPQKRAGLLASFLPASWFVAEDEPSEQERARAKAKVHYSIGQAYENKRALRQAEEAYENALRADPHYVPALLGLARVYQQTGRPDAALELYRQLTELAPDNPSVWNDMGLCYKNLGDLVEAEHCLRKAISLDPMRDLYRNNLAYVLACMGYYDQAWHEFRRAVGPALAHYNLAVVAYELGDHVTALKHATEALALNKDLEPARDLLRRLQEATHQGAPEQTSRLDLPATGHEQPVAAGRNTRPAVRVLGVRPER